MLPFLAALVQRFVDGPDATYSNANATPFKPTPLIATFTNDGQINQLAAELGVFDGQEPLPADRVLEGRTDVASRYVSMWGTIGFERLSCAVDDAASAGGRNVTEQRFVRIVLNNVVYLVLDCQSGPGRSCPLEQYAALLRRKQAVARGFATVCGIGGAVPCVKKSILLTDLGLPFEYVVRP